MGGRGAGKTRAGAEWLRGLVLSGKARRVALVGPTMSDVREVMISGESGLLSLGEPGDRPVYEPSRQRLVWPNGAVGYAFSAEEPNRLRGPQFDAAWVDEIAGWNGSEEAWDMLQFGLRLGDDPRIVATTTPQDQPLIKRLLKDDACAVTRGGTHANAAHLAPGFIAALRAQYGHGEMARQELDGELVEFDSAALFNLSTIDAARVAAAPEMDEIIVSVDPAVTSKSTSDACGIVVVGRVDSQAYLLHDATLQGVPSTVWAKRVAEIAEAWNASFILAESNQGGELVKQVLQQAGTGRAIKLVHARLGKRERAHPVAALYEAGRVHHVGHFRELEDELIAFGMSKDSPNRLDALVHGVTQLLLNSPTPRISTV